jgi:HAD superfamily hydrolase (TIGR01509 family)
VGSAVGGASLDGRRDRLGARRVLGVVRRAAAADPAAGPLLERFAEGRAIGILSNWPFAATIDRYVEAMGWSSLVRAIVVSQRVGVIKPHPEIFAAARQALGDPPPDAILHVGDDWAADVVGAARAGWRVAYVNRRPADSPLPRASGMTASSRTSRSPRSRSWRRCSTAMSGTCRAGDARIEPCSPG